MPRPSAFHPEGWESLEDRSLPSTAAGTAGPSPVVPVQRTDEYAVVRLTANLRKAEQGGAAIVLLGDSLTDFWTAQGAASWAEVLAPRGAVDFGIYGNTTGQLLAQIAAGELKGKPKVVVLMIGTNNLLQGDSPAQVAQGIAANVAAIRDASPQSKVLLMGLLPMLGGGDTPLSARVALINATISRLDDGAHVRFLNIGNAFLLPDGLQNPALFVNGIHLTASGYSVWASQVSGVLDALTGGAAPPQSTSLDPAPRHHRWA
jgi:lysophospholipase L1-like esterase